MKIYRTSGLIVDKKTIIPYGNRHFLEFECRNDKGASFVQRSRIPLKHDMGMPDKPLLKYLSDKHLLTTDTWGEIIDAYEESEAEAAERARVEQARRDAIPKVPPATKEEVDDIFRAQQKQFGEEE